jgi:hypothetical protein
MSEFGSVQGVTPEGHEALGREQNVGTPTGHGLAGGRNESCKQGGQPVGVCNQQRNVEGVSIDARLNGKPRPLQTALDYGRERGCDGRPGFRHEDHRKGRGRVSGAGNEDEPGSGFVGRDLLDPGLTKGRLECQLFA